MSRSSHAGWEPAADRPDPVALLEAQNATREPDLVPVRHGRMMVSPFTFYRGAAKIMAEDLKDTPVAGLNAQLCGDAHLSNFGVFASPERELVFDLNDFDETLPGPFEYDVKRMSASFTIVARNNGFSAADQRTVTLRSVTAYREAMTEFGAMSTLDVWYSHLAEQELMSAIGTTTRSIKGGEGKRLRKGAEKAAEKARTRDSLQALAKLDGDCRRRDPHRQSTAGHHPVARNSPRPTATRRINSKRSSTNSSARYRATLTDDRRHLLERYEFVDAARKVVGVGSVGTRAFIVLLRGRDQHDPLFLQVKEATKSVLEDHLPPSRYEPGERVVQGQRMMQAASDIFLGWTKGVQDNRFLYWRQLRDMKGSADIENMDPTGLGFYAGICGHSLARAHARSGDPVAMAVYLGKKDRFDQAMTDFSLRYADQNDRDYDEFCAAIKSGRLQAIEGV